MSEIVHEPGKVSGIRMSLGPNSYIVPPLNLKGLRANQDLIKEVQGTSMSPMDQLGIVGKIALSALQRNYPDLREDFVDEWIDLRNMQDVFEAVLGQSGYAKKAGDSGEAKATSTGPQSTVA